MRDKSPEGSGETTSPPDGRPAGGRYRLPMPIAALVFDFDGLILDTELSEYTTVKAEFEAHGVELPLEEWLDIIGRADHLPWIDWLEDVVGAPIEREIVHARRMAAHHEMIARAEVLPGVVDLLDQADAAGIPATVASSSTRSWVGGHLERLGLIDRFAALRTRDDVTRAKPWPDLFLAAVDAVGAKPADAVAFEDSHHGARAAVDAGLFCVVAPNPITRVQDFAHADLVVDSLAAVSLADVARRMDERL
jgi:HAD superfamily hydrolase (TIGR01509 family)